MRTLVLALAVGLVACGSKPPPPPPVAPQPRPRAVAVATPGPSPVGRPADALSYLSPTAEVIVGVDIGALLTADILAPHRERVLRMLPGWIAEVRSRCGIDLARDIDWLVIGVGHDGEDTVAVVRGDFTRAGIEQCLATGDDPVAIGERGDLRVYGEGVVAVYARWLGDGAVVVSAELAGDTPLLDGASGVTDMVLIDHANQVDDAHLWLVAGRAVFAGLPMQGAVGLRAELDAGSDLAVSVVIDHDTAANALVLKKQVDASLNQASAMGPEIERMLKAVQVEVGGPELEAHVVLDSADVAAIAKVFGMF